MSMKEGELYYIFTLSLQNILNLQMQMNPKAETLKLVW